MAEPVRTSPLAGVSADAVPGPEPVAIHPLPFRGKLVLRGGAAIHAAAARVLGDAAAGIDGERRERRATFSASVRTSG